MLHKGQKSQLSLQKEKRGKHEKNRHSEGFLFGHHWVKRDICLAQRINRLTNRKASKSAIDKNFLSSSENASKRKNSSKIQSILCFLEVRCGIALKYG
jgi:hypothetical protein